MSKKPSLSSELTELLRVREGFDLASFDRGSRPGLKGGSSAAEDLLADQGEVLDELQEELYAHGRTGGTRSVLLVLQGLDTAGKGGIVRHVVGLVDPQGVTIRSFGVPTAQEREHDFLWRVRCALPEPGRIGVFDRSHYEDVLVARVDALVPPEVWEARYDLINEFEAEVVAAGTVVVKAALMVSYEEQGERLAERLERPDKHWKYNPSDIDTRLRWDDYQEAYQSVFDRTSTEHAPWHVIPADDKDYARVAVSQLLVEALESLDLDWPEADFDVATEKARLEATRR